jgi:hypothetical protein
MADGPSDFRNAGNRFSIVPISAKPGSRHRPDGEAAAAAECLPVFSTKKAAKL